MNISINKDIEKYQESVVMGLTARQLIFSIASVACGGAIVLHTDMWALREVHTSQFPWWHHLH